MFAVALLDSAFIPLPGGPDALLMLLSAASPYWMPLYVISATVGSTMGCVILYSVSRGAGTRALRRFPASKVEKVRDLINRYDIFSVLVASLLPPPFPFKIFVVSAGVFGMNLGRFCIGVALGRSIRFTLEGILAARYGDQAKEIMAVHYKSVAIAAIAIVLAILLVRRFILRKRVVSN
jgi:membrane protein YqaA with SNARE-associated domain